MKLFVAPAMLSGNLTSVNDKKYTFVKAFCAYVQWKKAELILFCAAGNRFI
jgi:hypothetical protein